MPTRRLDDRIRQLCASAAAAPNHELAPILQELLEAIHQKIERLRGLTAKHLLHREHHKERRAPQP